MAAVKNLADIRIFRNIRNIRKYSNISNILKYSKYLYSSNIILILWAHMGPITQKKAKVIDLY